MQAWKIATPLLIALALVGCNKAEQAQNSAATQTNTGTATTTQHQDAREDIMKSWSKASKAMGAMVKDPTTFDAAKFKAEAETLNQDPWGHFGPDTKGGDALDTVWTDSAGFQQHIDKYKAAATALTTAAATATSVDGVKAQFADVSASCKGCHDKFKAD